MVNGGHWYASGQEELQSWLPPSDRRLLGVGRCEAIAARHNMSPHHAEGRRKLRDAQSDAYICQMSCWRGQ